MPTDRMGYAIRLLLLNKPGPTSYVDLRTVDGTTYPTFPAAAQAMRLTESDDIWVATLRDAAIEIMSNRRFRRFFAMLLFHCIPTDPEGLLRIYIDRLAPSRHGWTFADRRRQALRYLAYFLSEHNATLHDVGFDVPQEMTIDIDEVEQEIDAEDADVIPTRDWRQIASNQEAQLNVNQRSVLDEVLAAVNVGQYAPDRLFFVTGSGGTGKTFLFNTLISRALASGECCIATATTGIASLMLVGGLTAHRAFRIRNDVDKESNPSVEYESDFADRLRRAAFILIDEVSMLHADVFDYINKVILSIVPAEHRHMPFGGKVVILSGDFKQLPPVAPGEGREGQILASIRHSQLFTHFKHLRLSINMRVNPGERDFTNWLADVGTGKNMILGTPNIAIPEPCKTNTFEELVDFVFPNRALEDPINRVDDLRGAGILTTLNKAVFDLNEQLLDRVPTTERVYHSVDDVVMDRHEHAAALILDVHAYDLNIDSINKMCPTGLPPHRLRLKVGAVVMLIKNMSGNTGLCNGTMLQVLETGENLIKCRRLERNDRFDEIVFLPRIKFEFGNGAYDRTVKFSRLQFPIRLAFVNTINKAQGQTLKRVGLFFKGQQAFSHGQLYTAFSRVRNLDSIRVYTHGLPRAGELLNVVYEELLLE